MGDRLALANHGVNSVRALPGISGRYKDAGVDTKEIRRQKLNELIREYDNSQRKLAEAAEYNPSYISQLATGYRGIGEETARHLEQIAEKSAGWMDGIDDPLSLLPPEEAALVLKYRESDKRGKSTIQSVADAQSAYEGPDVNNNR